MRLQQKPSEPAPKGIGNFKSEANNESGNEYLRISPVKAPVLLNSKGAAFLPSATAYWKCIDEVNGLVVVTLPWILVVVSGI